jgi:putative ABC transport system permease protein
LRKLFLKNWRDIAVRKSQFAALIALVMLGIASYIATIAAYQNLFSSYQFVYEKLKFADITVKVRSAPKSIVDEVKSFPEVKEAQGRLIIDTGLYLDEENQATVRVIGIPPDKHPLVNDVYVEKGSYLSRDERDACLLEKHFAEYYKKEPGDTLKILINGEKHEVAVKGIVSSPEYLVTSRSREDILPSARRFAVIFMPQKEVERLFRLPPSYNDISVLLEDGASVVRSTAQIEKVLDSYHLIETLTQDEQPSNAALQMDLEGYREIAYTMPLLILIIASLSLYIALSRLVQSQRGEIGLAKALGYSNGQILLHYLIFSLLIAVCGFILGLVIGQWLAGSITKLYAAELGIPFVKTQIYWDYVAEAAIMSFVCCVLAGMLPARASAKIPPAQAMRVDSNLVIAKGRTPLIEKAISRFYSLPFLIKIPLRNVFRVKKRSFYTILGISFALILTLATWSFFDAMDWMLSHQINAIEKWDVMAAFSQSFSRNRIHQVESWEGVHRVQAALQIPVKIKAHGQKHETIATALEPAATFRGFDIAEGASAESALKRGGIILTPLVAEKLKVKIGDSVLVETPLLEDRSLKFTLLATSDELMGAPAFISFESGKKLIRAPGDVFNSLYIEVDEDKATEIKKKLYDLSGIVDVMIKKSIIADWQELMGLFYLFMGVLLAFAFSLAFAVVYNTFTTNIMERQRELGTMRTIGEGKGRLAIMITLENLILALAGIPLGIYLGLETAKSMMKSFQSELFSMRVVIYPISYLWVIGSVLLILLLSEIPAIRRVFKLNLAEATKIVE